MPTVKENDITNDLKVLEYILVCHPYGWDRIGCHGQLGYVLKVYKRLQRKARKPLHFSQRIRWNAVHKMYLEHREKGYFDPTITSCNACTLSMNPACEFKNYTKHTKYK